MKHFILTFTIHANLLFFSIFSLLGLNYGGAEESSSFMLFCASSAFIAIAITLKYDAFTNKVNSNKIMYVVPLFVLCFEYLRVSTFYINAPNLDHIVLVSLCYSIPAIFSGAYFANEGSILKTRRWFDFTMLLISIGLVFSLPQMIISENVTLSGTTYQALSYMAAYAACYNFYEILESRNQSSSSYYSKLFFFIRLFLLGVQIFCTFLGGGRGAAVLLVIGPIVIMYFEGVKFKASYVITPLFFIFTLLIIVAQIEGFLSDRLLSGFERAFSFIGESGIDMSQTSGRENVYREAWESFLKSPFFGYGLLGYLVTDNFVIGYSPHNFFLQVLLQGGLIFFIVILFFLKWLFGKFKVLLTINRDYIFLIPVFLFPMINLMFSGDYLMSPLFWFIVSFLCTFDSKSLLSEI